MRAIIESNEWIYLENVTNHEDNTLWVEFSAAPKNIGYINQEQLGSMWDGIHRKYNRAKKRIARPLLSMLIEVCQNKNLPLSIIDKRKPPKYTPAEINEDSLPGIKLEDYQVQWGKIVAENEVGICSVPTGGGKGELIALTCKVRPCPTVILADQTIVLSQLKKRLELRDVAPNIGEFYAGKRPNGEPIIIGSIQALSAPTKPPQIPSRTESETEGSYDKKLAEYNKKLAAFRTRRKNAKILLEYIKLSEMVIVDECDRSTSKSYKTLFRFYFRGRYRYGFSGTPFDKNKPVENLVLKEHLGSIIMHQDRKTILARGRIIDTQYIAVALDGNPNESSTYDIAITDHMENNRKFHELITKITKFDPNENYLILVDRISIGEKLHELFKEKGIHAPFICGTTTKKKQIEALTAFEQKTLKVLIGGKIINRGLDLKGGCDNLIIIFCGKSHSEFKQRVGRGLRLNEKGNSKVYSFYFRCNKHLYHHSREWLKCMVEEGYRTTVIFKNGIVEGQKLVQSRFRIPKGLIGF